MIALGLPFTPYGYSPDDILGGLAFAIPAGTIGAAIAMFGITGVGADEFTFYTYWCVEKGYARYVGPPTAARNGCAAPMAGSASCIRTPSYPG